MDIVEASVILFALGVLSTIISFVMLSRFAAHRRAMVFASVAACSTTLGKPIVRLWRDTRKEVKPSAILIGLEIPSIVLTVWLLPDFLSLVPLVVVIGIPVALFRAFHFHDVVFLVTAEGVYRVLTNRDHEVPSLMKWEEIRVSQSFASPQGPLNDDIYLLRGRETWVVAETMVNFDYFCGVLASKIGRERFWPPRVYDFASSLGRKAGSEQIMMTDCGHEG